jgi:PAS domain S-box-containing protein
MSGQPVRVLLVEDEEAHAELVCRAFEAHGGHFVITVADSLKAARESLACFSPDLVITDLVLPDGEGTELLTIEDGRPSFPMVVMTAHGDQNKAVEAMKRGALDYVVKSEVTLADMAYITERALRQWQLIIQRRGAEEALRESEELYRHTMDAAMVGVFVAQDGRFRFVNAEMARLYGYQPEEMVDCLDPSDLMVASGWADDRGGAAAGSGQGKGVEVRCLRRDASTFGGMLLERNVAFGGRPAVVGTLIDISERKQTEREKQEILAQLLHAQKMEAVGILAGGIAHDFNNLLQAVHGYAQLLLLSKQQGDPGYRELHEIVRAAGRGGELTKQLLTFGRRVESKRQPLDLNHEVLQVKRILERTIPKMIEIDVDLAPDLKAIDADPVQVEQVLMNLAVNARDAMPNGGRLTVTTQNVVLSGRFGLLDGALLPGEYALLAMSDTGQGMDAETLEHIFEPFYTTKGPGRGSGLGLAMIYGIVKNHSGHISCRSELGRGTTFSIYLPVVGAQTRPAAASQAHFPLQGGSETILLVDDEEPLRDLGKQILARFGYTVVTAANGETGLEIYRGKCHDIDLVILDLIMPGMGGTRCLEELLAFNPKVKILIASGHTPEGPTQLALGSGACGFVAKPFEVSGILRAVRAVLDADRPTADGCRR